MRASLANLLLTALLCACTSLDGGRDEPVSARAFGGPPANGELATAAGAEPVGGEPDQRPLVDPAEVPAGASQADPGGHSPGPAGPGAGGADRAADGGSGRPETGAEPGPGAGTPGSPGAGSTAGGGDGVPATAAPEAAAGSMSAPAAPVASAPADDARPGWLRIDLPGGSAPIWIPRDEELVYRVRVDLGILGTVTAGQVVLRSGAERYVSGLPPAGSTQAAARTGLEVGWIESHASGEAAGYRLDHVLHTRILPQPWPRIFYMSTQKGSDPRRRELKIGVTDGKPSSWYRNDGHCKGCDNPEHFVESNWVWGKPSHCGKCKRAEHRTWRPSKSRAVPEGTLDTLSAVYLARETIRSGDESLRFPMVEKERLWDVEVRAGARRKIEVPAGRFDSRRVELVTRRPPGEEVDEDERFEGMFGIRGKIQIWMEASSGVPVRIDGELPVPVIGDLEVQVELVRYRGAPEGFGPAE